MSIKVLMITSTPPIPSSGGSIVLYRHVCERQDFEIMVITNNPQIYDYPVPYKFVLLKRSKFWERAIRTRLSKHLHSLEHLLFGLRIPKAVWQTAQAFDPDLVLTVAGSWSWTSRLARQVARRLDVPLVASFMDWWFYNQIFAHWAAAPIEAAFRRLYRQCDLALCISEGMEAALGSHPNAAVIYPIGPLLVPEITSEKSNFDSDLQVDSQPPRPFIVAFVGNLNDWYGRMIEPLVVAAEDSDIGFQLYGPSTSWSAEFEDKARALGIYHGYLPLLELHQALQKVDALFLVMGFDPACAQIEKTSFKSKFLEYLSFQKPVFVWGPEYCSAVGYAREFDSAEICTSPNPKDFLQIIKKVKHDPTRQQTLVRNAKAMYADRFNPETIHRHFVDKLKELVS